MAVNKRATTERELVSKITEWFNENIKRNKYPFKDATNEVPAKYDLKTYFGDIVLWIDRAAAKAYSYIEIKPPFAAKEDKDTLRKKAISYGVKYCFTWDFQNFVVYEIKETKLEFHSSEATPIMSEISAWLNGDIQATIKKQIISICDEIKHLNETGKFRRYVPDKVYFVNYIRATVNKLVPQFEKHYTDLAADKEMRKKIMAYGNNQGLAFKEPDEYYKLLAGQSVYNLITKIIFYLTIRRYFSELPDLYTTGEPDLGRYLKIAFAKAQEKDWQAVFEESVIEQFNIPKSCYNDLYDFFAEMRVYHFGELPEDVIGELFEEIIDPEKRHLLGQYFTNENLVDFILGFAVNDANGIYADTTCGSGTFLIRIYDRLKYLSKTATHLELLNKIWGFDIAKFPAELATINLFRQEISNFENFPRIKMTDIFDVNKGDEFDFPPPSANKKYSNKVKIKLPEFNSIVGNFPFIRQELIEKNQKDYKKRLTKAIALNYFLTYPRLFTLNNIKETNLEHLKKLTLDKLEKEISLFVDKGNIQLKLSGQADIYAYIFIHAATLLAHNGTFAVITSNSWLDVSYGSILKEFFLDNFKIKAVIGSWAEPWFEDAAVNTIVTILEKKDDPLQRENNITRFVKLKKKFADLIPYQDLKLESIKRWRTIDNLVNTIETAEGHRNIENINENIQSLDIEEMRIRLVRQSFLSNEINENGELAKWGKYLRAPDVYFEILDKCKDKLVPLKDIAEVRRGYTTGINEFFYLETVEKKPNGNFLCRNAGGWEGLIEGKYLRPVIKSPKESESITIDPEKLKFKIFLCNSSKAELRGNGDINALKYIEWGEKRRTKEGILWKDVPSVKGRTSWYGIEEKFPASILLQMINNDRFIAFDNNVRVQVDHNLFEWMINDNIFETMIVYLNSSFFNLLREVNSRVNLGEGATKTEGIDWNNLMLAPKKEIDIRYNNKKTFKQKVLPVFSAIKQKDRISLDTKVLEALGLNAGDYLPKIYAGLCELVKERLELPKMRKKKKKEGAKFAYGKVKENVIEDCLPEGVKIFPHDFYTKGDYDSLKFDSYSSNGMSLRADSFFNRYLMKTEEGETILELDAESKAEFAEILTHKPIYEIKIPSSDKVVEEILKKYKTYKRKLKEIIIANAKEKVHDWAIAEKMAKDILEEFGLR